MSVSLGLHILQRKWIHRFSIHRYERFTVDIPKPRNERHGHDSSGNSRDYKSHMKERVWKFEKMHNVIPNEGNTT